MEHQQEANGLYSIFDSEMSEVVLAIDCHCDTLEKERDSMPDGPLRQALEKRIEEANDVYNRLAESFYDLVDMGRISETQKSVAFRRK